MNLLDSRFPVLRWWDERNGDSMRWPALTTRFFFAVCDTLLGFFFAGSEWNWRVLGKLHRVMLLQEQDQLEREREIKVTRTMASIVWLKFQPCPTRKMLPHSSLIVLGACLLIGSSWTPLHSPYSGKDVSPSFSEESDWVAVLLGQTRVYGMLGSPHV